MLHWIGAAAVAIVWSLFAGSAALAQTDGIPTRCAVQNDHNTICDLRSLTSKRISKIEARIDGQLKSVEGLKPLSDSGDRIAVLFLVDATKSMRPKAITEIKRQIQAWIDNSDDIFVFGVASFGTSLNLLADIGSDKSSLQKAVDGLKADQPNTALYEITNKAIKLLEKQSAARSFVVLLTDGDAEDNAVRRAEVQNTAVEAGVTIIAAGYKPLRSKPGKIPLQGIRLLAEGSGGLFIEASDDNALPDIAGQLHKLMRSGGTVEIDTSDEEGTKSLQLLVTLSDSSLVSKAQTLDFTGKPSLTSRFLAYWNSGALGKVVIAGAGLALLLGLFFLISLLTRRRPISEVREATTICSPETEMDVSDTTGAYNSGLTYAFVDLLDGVGPPRREPITSTSFRIGRAPSNDLVLDHSTVSNDHAVVTIDQNNTFEIRDVHSANGTKVNGETVGRATLSNGDSIELGRVSMRLVMN